MCQQCRDVAEEALIEATRDPHLIALVLAGHADAKWFREHLRLTVLMLRAGDCAPEDLLARLGEHAAECPRVSGHCGPLIERAITEAERWRAEASPPVPPGRLAASHRSGTLSR